MNWEWIEFVGQDEEYKKWFKDNPDAYVINCYRSKSLGYRVLHRSNCHSITKLSKKSEVGGFTEREYIKICSNSIEGLKAWSVKHGAKDRCFSNVCSHCMKYGVGEVPSSFDEFEQGVIRAKSANSIVRLDAIRKYDGVVSSQKVSTMVYTRNPNIVAETLLRAKGVCEKCGENAPFKRKSDNSPYLEVHHKIPLSEGGLDLLTNTLALCPNCHREAHFG